MIQRLVRPQAIQFDRASVPGWETAYETVAVSGGEVSPMCAFHVCNILTSAVEIDQPDLKGSTALNKACKTFKYCAPSHLGQQLKVGLVQTGRLISQR
jgi:hypothetical protein